MDIRPAAAVVIRRLKAGDDLTGVERVAAFLAVLELVKDKRLRVDGDGEDCEIKLTNGGE